MGALSRGGCPDDRTDPPDPSPRYPQDDAQIAPLKPGDTVLVTAMHSAPSGDRTGAAVDNTLPARLNRSRLSPTQLRAVRFLQFTCGVPEPVIQYLMGTKKRTVVAVAAWCGAWYWAISVEFGAVFAILSAIAAIFTVGLGTRKEGEASAYSIFNGFNELPGAFNAAQLDDQMRHRNEQAAQGPYIE
jgi:hypothetical protein